MSEQKKACKMMEAVKLGKTTPVPKKKSSKIVDLGKKPICFELLAYFKKHILGLSFITGNHSSSDIICVCDLCAGKFDRNIISSHVTGNKHRLSYLKEKKPHVCEHLKKFGGKKSQLSASLDELSIDCEKTDGCVVPVSKVYEPGKADENSNFRFGLLNMSGAPDKTKANELELSPSDAEALEFQDWVANEVNKTTEVKDEKEETAKQSSPPSGNICDICDRHLDLSKTTCDRKRKSRRLYRVKELKSLLQSCYFLEKILCLFFSLIVLEFFCYGIIKLMQMPPRDVVDEAPAKCNADPIGRDYALESVGGTVLDSSDTYLPKSGLMYSMFGLKLWYHPSSPRAVIQPNFQPGRYWVMDGRSGYVTIKLAMPVIVSAVSLELPTSGHISSAPRHFAIKGNGRSMESPDIILGIFTYHIGKESIQVFEIKDPFCLSKTDYSCGTNNKIFSIITLMILDNHGNPDFTSVYRLRVHGKPAILVDADWA